MSKPQLHWTVIQQVEYDGIEVVLQHQKITAEIDPWRVLVRRESQFEIEDFPAEEAARSYFNEVCALVGVDTTPVILEPETTEQLYATWWARFYQTKQKMPAQEEVEMAFAADPVVQASARDLMAFSSEKKGWVDTLMRCCLRPILGLQKEQELARVSQHHNFGRFA